MPSSLFQMRRHTRRPPPVCKSTWKNLRLPTEPNDPRVLTGWARWVDGSADPPIDVAILIDVYPGVAPVEYFGSSKAPGVLLTLTIEPNANPDLYDLILAIETPSYSDDDSWHGLVRPQYACDWDSGIQSHIHTPGVDENYARLSL